VLFTICAIGWVLYPSAAVWAVADGWRVPVSTGMLLAALAVSLSALTADDTRLHFTA
jgi:hypothetical protein